jgi:DNA-binding transcriptional LysR family regulator
MVMPTLNLHRLRVFQAVARRSSYTGAAEELSISQPAVSSHVRQLERDLRVKLFYQVGRRIYLTDAGHLVQDYTQRLFATAEEMGRALAELEGLERGTLRLAASSTWGLYLLPQALARFRARYPRVEIALDISDSQQATEQLLARRVELGFVGAYPGEAGIQVQPYARDELVAILPPSHRLGGASHLSLEELRGESWVVMEEGSGTRQTLEEALGQALPEGAVLKLRGPEAVKRAVAAGLGVAVISSLALADGRSGLLAIPLHPPLRRPLLILSLKGGRMSAAALAFLSLLRKEVSALAPLSAATLGQDKSHRAV